MYHGLDRKELIRNGGLPEDRRARHLSLEALGAALAAINPSKCLRSWVHVKHDQLIVGELSIPLLDRIGVMAVGKASVPMIETAMRILGKRVTTGILVAPKGKAVPKHDRRITVSQSGHPIPDQVGIRASKEVLLMAKRMRENETMLKKPRSRPFGHRTDRRTAGIRDSCPGDGRNRWNQPGSRCDSGWI